MTYHKVSDKYLKEFKELCDKKDIKYETEAEYENAARNLVSFVDLLVEMDMAQRALKRRLETEPEGFTLEGKGRNCSLCRRSVYEGDGWYDKWGFKCSNCQDAVNKRKISGSLCGDYRHEKSIPDTVLASKLNISVRTIRKRIKDGEIIGRRIPDGPYMILRKDNLSL